MGNELKVFQSEQFGQVRMRVVDGDPWFATADSCKALDIKNPSQTISYLDEDEKMTLLINEGHSGQRGWRTS